jgi:hypothetical protein
MIGLTRLNGRPVVVNAELIETVESTPDTVVSLTNVHYRQRAGCGPALTAVCGEQAVSQHED